VNSLPPYHARGEIERIATTSRSAPEILLRVRGRKFDPDRPSTFVRIRRRQVYRRRLSAGSEVAFRLRMTARFVEERETPARTLEVNGRRGSGRIPRALRIVGYDTRIAGEVVEILDPETIAMDAGVPILVTIPRPHTGLPETGEFVEFLVQEPPEVEFF